VSPETGKLVATVRFLGAPLDLATSTDAVWLADQLDNVVYRIDPASYEVVASETAAGESVLAPQTLASASGSVWLGAIGGHGETLVLPIAPDSGARAKPIRVLTLARNSAAPGPPLLALTQLVPDESAASSGRFSGWVLDASSRVIRKLQPGSPEVLSPRIETGSAPHVGATTSTGDLWVGQAEEVVKISGGKLAARTQLSDTPVALAVRGGGVWVATVDGRLVFVDPDGSVSRTIRTSGTPVDLALAGGSLWLLSRDGTLSKRDATSGESLTTEEVGSNAVALAASQDSIWVAVHGGRQLERSGLPGRLKTTAGFPNILVADPCGPTSGSSRCRQTFVLVMLAEGGARSGFSGYWWERRTTGGAVECNGKRYRGRVVSAIRNAGSGTVWVEHWGTFAVRIDRVVVVAEALDGAPICGDVTGAWLATSGRLKGERGEFVFLGPPPERIILR
jgi:streptogramin lyase